MVLSKKLDAAGVEYEVIEDIETIQSYGVEYVPALVMEDGEILDFTRAVSWVNNYR
jgi:predicted DsbA family dithiol-disulfide isomerase